MQYLHIAGISQAYRRHIAGISQAYRRHIAGIEKNKTFWGYWEVQGEFG